MADRLAGAALVSWGASLPFIGLGTWTFHHAIGAELADLVFVATIPVLVWPLRGNLRSVALNPLVLACAALLAAAALTAVVRGDLPAEARDLARHAGRLAVVAVLVAAARHSVGDRALVGLAVSGSLVAAASLVALVIHVAGGTTAGAHAGVFVGPMPILGTLPRLTGSSGPSAQHMGEICVATLAALLLSAPRAARAVLLRRIGMSVTALALFFTWSAAWLGAVLLGLGWLAMRRRIRPALAGGAAVVATLAVAWLVHLGTPDGRAPQAPCVNIDALHVVTAYLDTTETLCRRQVRTSPYRSMLTTYRDAAETSAAAFALHPFAGVGRHGYVRFARERARDRAGSDAHHVSHYTSPHSLLGLPASHGLPGAIGLIALLAVATVGALRATTPAARGPWLALCTFLVLGLSSDILDVRVAWAILGSAATAAHGATRAPA